MTTRRPGPAAAAVVAGLLALCASAVAPATASAAAPEWNIERVGAPVSAAGTVIAVVDTGVDSAHPAFTGRVLAAIDLIGGSGGDPNGHGTHVAGTAAGADNGCGSIGVAPDAAILPVRVLDEEGGGSARNVAEGIRRAADAGATVINLSLGSDVAIRNVAGSGLEEAIGYAWQKGSIPVLAAGNDGVVGDVFGGSGYRGIPAVVVTATDNQDRIASYATTIGSAEWGVAAPGGDASEQEGRDITSAFPGRRCALQAGTSMAAPHVSGALAALRARGLGPRQAVDRLLATARDLGRPGPDATYGHGLIDLRAAVGGPAPAAGAPAAPAAPQGGSAPAPAAQASPTTAAPAEQSPRDTASPSPSSPAPAPAPSSAPGPRPTAVDEATTGPDEQTTPDGVADAGPATTRAPSSEGGSAAPVVVQEADDDGDGAPGGLVAVAVAALAASGIGAGVVSRRLGRRPGGV